MNNGSGGNGNAYGLCSDRDIDDLKDAKSDYYFDAEDAAAFKDAFETIGRHNVERLHSLALASLKHWPVVKAGNCSSFAHNPPFA